LPLISADSIAVLLFFDDNIGMNQTQNEWFYSLEVKVPDQSPRKIDVHDEVNAGLDPRNDLILVGPKIMPRHFHFIVKNDVLSVLFLGEDNTTFLNDLPLENNKKYLLEKNDVLKCGRVQITIKHLHGLARPLPQKVNTHVHEPVVTNIHLASEQAPVEPVATSAPAVKTAPKKNSDSAPKKVLALKKIPLKIYGFIFDLTLTYFITAFLIPASGLLGQVQSVLFPMTEFFTTIFLTNHPQYSSFKILSLVEFFILFHFVMISSALFFGNTPGAILTGLYPSGSALGNRFKAYLYTLINCVALPFIVFDIPLFKGMTLKEWLSFYPRNVRNKNPYLFFQKTIVPAFIVLFLLSPLFLKFPFSAIVVEEKLGEPKFKETHIEYLTSTSATLGTALKTELNSQFSVLPYLSGKSIGLTLYDHDTGKSIIMNEEWRLKTEEALFSLRFSNPLSSLYLPNDEINSEILKTKTFEALMVSPLNLFQTMKNFGLFFGNAFLFKENFLKNFSATDSLLAMPFNPKNPFLLISSSKEQMIFWFTPHEIIAFRLTVPKQTKLLEHFTHDLIGGMRFNQAYSDRMKEPQILEALEAFESGKTSALLTYYIYEAKKASVKITDHPRKNTPEWRSFLKKNILQAKLSTAGNKNIEKSFDDIMNTLK
jgi:hypothetical protein